MDTDVNVRIVKLVMADNPLAQEYTGTCLSILGDNRITIISSNVINNNTLSQRGFFSVQLNRSNLGNYLVEISVPQHLYDEVLQELKNDPLILNIDGINTESGERVENAIQNLSNNNRQEQSNCCIM
jgi:hypothetical protein